VTAGMRGELAARPVRVLFLALTAAPPAIVEPPASSIDLRIEPVESPLEQSQLTNPLRARRGVESESNRGLGSLLW
jgi:hypothetical protein